MKEESARLIETTETQLAEVSDKPWPDCPVCHNGRTAVCPYCDSTSTEFPLADENYVYRPGEHVTHRAVLCTTCDEPFVPSFYNRCAYCNHQFADGIEVEQGERSAEEIQDSTLTPRAATVLVGLIGIAIVVLGYFFILVTWTG